MVLSLWRFGRFNPFFFLGFPYLRGKGTGHGIPALQETRCENSLPKLLQFEYFPGVRRDGTVPAEVPALTLPLPPPLVSPSSNSDGFFFLRSQEYAS